MTINGIYFLGSAILCIVSLLVGIAIGHSDKTEIIVRLLAHIRYLESCLMSRGVPEDRIPKRPAL